MIALSNASARQQKKKTNKPFNFRKLWAGCVSWNKGSQRRSFTLSHLHNVQRILNRVHAKNTFFKHFSRATLDFQGPPIRNTISQIVQKCTFPVYSNKTLRLVLFASPTSLHCQFTS